MRRVAPGWLGMLATTLILTGGCATREETPQVAEDSTLVYPARNAGDVEASITFASRVSRKSGRRSGVSQAFDMEADAKVIALVDLNNTHARGERPLQFHLVWLKPSGKTLFKKSIDYTPGDPDSTLQSSISIPPGKRPPGWYSFRVYLARELIAEKNFELRGIGGEEEVEEEEEL